MCATLFLALPDYLAETLFLLGIFPLLVLKLTQEPTIGPNQVTCGKSQCVTVPKYYHGTALPMLEKMANSRYSRSKGA